MPTEARYPIPAAEHRVETVVQRSRFVATLGPAATVEEAQAFVRRVAAEFAGATHNCWAYVVGPPGSTARIGMSDAGEPHGTAGRPMLTALLHGGLGDVAAVVTRFYGGTKLGTGGLVRAYGGAVQEALLGLPRAERVEYAELDVGVEYPHVAAVQQLLPAYEGEVLAQEYLERVRYRVRLPSPNAEEFTARLRDATRGAAEVRRLTADG
ncbi:MAG: YigZ family protein [Gemmatimonadaceae bacterium]